MQAYDCSTYSFSMWLPFLLIPYAPSIVRCITTLFRASLRLADAWDLPEPISWEAGMLMSVPFGREEAVRPGGNRPSLFGILSNRRTHAGTRTRKNAVRTCSLHQCTGSVHLFWGPCWHCTLRPYKAGNLLSEAVWCLSPNITHCCLQGCLQK